LTKPKKIEIQTKEKKLEHRIKGQPGFHPPKRVERIFHYGPSGHWGKPESNREEHTISGKNKTLPHGAINHSGGWDAATKIIDGYCYRSGNKKRALEADREETRLGRSKKGVNRDSSKEEINKKAWARSKKE